MQTTKRATTNTTVSNMSMMTKTVLAPLTAALIFLAAPAARAGQGSSPGAIQRAIASGSVDAISAELERAERLRCEACVKMVRPLVDHEDGRIRRVATWWLARRGLRSELFVEMALRLAQPDSALARNAADVLGSLRHPMAQEPLGAALNNPLFDAEARASMAAALGRIGDPAAAPALKSATHAELAPVRAAALAALRELRGPIDATLALGLLSDGDAGVRSEAIYTIGASRGLALAPEQATAVVEGLVRVLGNDSEAGVRKKAAWALGELGLGAELAGPALAEAARTDADPAVRSLAQAAFARLGQR